MVFFKLKLWQWPIVASFWFVLTISITYTTAVLTGHVYPVFPYISDTGTTPPESCIFSQMMNINALFLGITLYIRYLQVDFLINSENITLNRRWNTAAFWAGNIVCLGMSMVANFQENAVLPMHLLGAFCAFGIGFVYMVLQVRISFAMRPFYDSRPECKVGSNIVYVRIFFTIALLICQALVFICTAIAVRQFTGQTILWWTEDAGGFKMHLAATISEWLLVAMFGFHTLSFAIEFKPLEYDRVALKYNYANVKNVMLESI